MSEMTIQDPRSDLAQYVAKTWDNLKQGQRRFLERTSDVRAYVTANTTADTMVGSLPWKNKTTIPKLTQIADNLQSYYMAAAMPTRDWFKWEGFDMQSQKKAQMIESYVGTKLEQSRYRATLEQCVRDWLIYGNAFMGVTYVKETAKSFVTGQDVVIYQGPRAFRISPLDCVMDYKAPNFDKSPFIRRTIVPLTDVLTFNDTHVSTLYDSVEVEKLRTSRGYGCAEENSWVDWFKDQGFDIDGFIDINDYLGSSEVELLEYWGDVYVESTGEVLKNRVITIADRSWVLRNAENPSWSGKKPFFHSGWRILPDNLYGQGPLENLVGMQYRCDHLENLKADAFDQIIHPMIFIKGDDVSEFQFGPGQRIYGGMESDVEFLRPDVSVLQCNNEIATYHSYMELYAGSPREAAGFRTPGEKTAFEMNVLQQGADRMFLDKLNHFEINIIQPSLNMYFEQLMRNFDIQDVARTFNDDPNAMELQTITRDDVIADGIFKAIGSSYFAARNKRVQELNNFLQIMAMPTLAPHLSGVRSAEMLEEELGMEKWNIVEAFVALKEQAEGQAMAQNLQQMMGVAPQEEEMM